MLDFNEELEKFQPCADLEDAEENFDGDELEQIKQNKTELYKANQMIKKYNQALNYAKQGNDDLAMLQLKNVVAAIPNFTDAYLLMALLSMKAEDYGTAKDALDQIFAIDPENESAKEYMKEFKAEPEEEVKAEERKEKERTEGKKREEREKGSGTGCSEVKTFQSVWRRHFTGKRKDKESDVLYGRRNHHWNRRCSRFDLSYCESKL